MKPEYKALRDQIRVAVPNPVMRRSVLLKIGKALRAMREECAAVAELQLPKRSDLDAFVSKRQLVEFIAAGIRGKK